MVRSGLFPLVRSTALASLAGLALAAAACGGSNQAPASSASAAAAAAPATAAEQADLGAKLYGQSCAGCHGASGEGTAKAPPVVGKNALPLDPPPNAKYRKTQFKTAKDVFDFVQKAMPPGKADTVTDDQKLDIMAFDLKANGVTLPAGKLDAASAQAIVLHP